jgi:uncharacterized RDD family membrane protein YckC
MAQSLVQDSIMNMKPASIFKRMLAYIVDVILIMILWRVAKLLVKPLHSASLVVQNYLRQVIKCFLEQDHSSASEIITSLPSYIESSLIILSIPSFLYLAYFVFFEQSKWQGTIGKRLLKLKVVDITNKRISALKALKRHLIYMGPNLITLMSLVLVYITWSKIHMLTIVALMVFSLTCSVIGWFLLIPIFFTKNKVTAYDMMSKTKIVSQRL